jgi:hypothetical protein
LRRLAGGAAIEDAREAGLTFEAERGYEVTLFVDAACLKNIVDFASLLAAQVPGIAAQRAGWRSRSQGRQRIGDGDHRSVPLSSGRGKWMDSQTIPLEKCNALFGASNG